MPFLVLLPTSDPDSVVLSRLSGIKIDTCESSCTHFVVVTALSRTWEASQRVPLCVWVASTPLYFTSTSVHIVGVKV